jgi:RimJ/RimL family protein N-acetyltransferase
MAFTAKQPVGLGLWALEQRESGEFVGQVGLFPVEGKGPDVEVAYELAPRAWGRGYATEAARALIDYGFSEIGLARIVALILSDNVRSRRVAEKCAMTLEGPGSFYGLDLLVYARARDNQPAASHGG